MVSELRTEHGVAGIGGVHVVPHPGLVGQLAHGADRVHRGRAGGAHGRAGEGRLQPGGPIVTNRLPQGVGPTLLDNVPPDMSVYRDEIFGPVLSVVRTGAHQEAIDLINANPHGTGTAVFANDGGAARKFQAEIKVGMVGINVPIPVPLAFYSFGGWKESILGDHFIYGPDGVHFYTPPKVVISRWPDPIPPGRGSRVPPTRLAGRQATQTTPTRNPLGSRRRVVVAVAPGPRNGLLQELPGAPTARRSSLA